MTAPTSFGVPAVGSRACQHGFVTALLLRCGRGDPASFGQLFDLFYPSVSAAAAARVPGHRVESAVTEAFAHLWRQAPSFRPGERSAVGWVMDQVSAGLDLAPLGYQPGAELTRTA